MMTRIAKVAYKVRRAYRRWKWRRDGALMVEYRGYHCGLCGDWVEDRFFVPEYRSVDEWQDTVGMCPKCRGDKLTWQEIIGWD